MMTVGWVLSVAFAVLAAIGIKYHYPWTAVGAGLLSIVWAILIAAAMISDAIRSKK